MQFSFEEKIHNPHQEYRGQGFNITLSYELLERVCEIVYQINGGHTVMNIRPAKKHATLFVVYINNDHIEKFRKELNALKQEHGKFDKRSDS